MVELWEVWQCEGELCISSYMSAMISRAMTGVCMHMAGCMAAKDLEI